MKQYDDAKNVRKMLAAIDKKEEAAFNKVFEDKMATKVDKLSALHKGDSARLEEKLSATRWRDVRRREREQSIARQNIKNKTLDMAHFQHLDATLKPEMIVKPSALLQKRRNFNQTASYMRGAQLLDKVKGKNAGDAVFIEGLCGIHKFGDKKLSGTIKHESDRTFGVKPYKNKYIDTAMNMGLFETWEDPYGGEGCRVKVRRR